MKILLRKVDGALCAMIGSTGALLRSTAGPARGLTMPLAGVSLGFLALVLVIAGALLAALTFGEHATTGALLAFPAVATTRDLKTILADLTKIQTDYKGKPMPEDVGKQFEDLAKEAKSLQDEADRDAQIKRFERFAAEVPDPVLPGQKGRDERKASKDDVAGYVSVGTLFTSSEAYRAYKAAGAPGGMTTLPVAVDGLQGRYVPVNAEQRKGIEEAMRETKAVVTIGSGVLDAQRVAEIVRVTENDELRLRDLVNVSTTSEGTVEWTRIASYTRAAAAVAESASKPEATMSVENITTSVKTIAVWMPVTEQQMQDARQVVNLIDAELLYDLDKVEEEEMIYGDGTGQHFLGIANDTGVLTGRTVSGDTNLDKIRRSITDVRRSGFRPNGVAIDPLDWEGIVLLKGTDDRYVWVVVTDADGQRVWGLRVVETVAMEANAGDTTEERNIIVGDFTRGATLWDRQQAVVQVGWINDQFIKNQRTLRAEKRAAFAVRRPKAFRKIVAQAAVA